LTGTAPGQEGMNQAATVVAHPAARCALCTSRGGADDVNDQRLGEERLDKPAGVEQNWVLPAGDRSMATYKELLGRKLGFLNAPTTDRGSL